MKVYHMLYVILQTACHHREDSHSETSGETTTTQDSGKGNSVDGGDNYGM